MKDFVIGRKVKVYRVIHCGCCNQFFEVDLSEVFDSNFTGGTQSVKTVCPWCDNEDHFKFINLQCANDRIVKYD